MLAVPISCLLSLRFASPRASFAALNAFLFASRIAFSLALLLFAIAA
jgi:hypothetical protein